MSLNRRDLLQTASAAAAIASTAGIRSALAGSVADFSIDRAFADFMQRIGGGADDAGGSVRFTGADPIVRSHFRIGSAMAIPAMAAAVGAAAIWRERTGDGQDLSVDLRDWP